MALRTARRTAGSRPIWQWLRAALRDGGQLQAPPTDPELDVAAFRAGEPLVMLAHRKTRFRCRNGVLVLNAAGPGCLTWHRGIERWYRASGELLHTPFVMDNLRWLGDESAWKARPMFYEVRLLAAGQPWTLRINVWDLRLFCVAADADPARFLSDDDQRRHQLSVLKSWSQ